MNSEPAAPAQPSFRATKAATVVACVFFLFGAALQPGAGSSLGMPWPVFFCTYGVMLVAAFVGVVGYFACKDREESIGVFYLICPALLFVALLHVWNLGAIACWFAS